MADETTDIDDSIDLDRLCWAYVASLADFEYRVFLDKAGYDGDHVYDDEFERGYASGMYNQICDILEQFDTEGIDVISRAREYSEENDLSSDFEPAWLEDVETPDGEPLAVDIRKDGRRFHAVPEDQLDEL